MEKEMYRGKRVILSCPADLYTFYSLIGYLDDTLEEDHYLRTDKQVAAAWLALLSSLETAINSFCTGEGCCSSKDIVCLFCDDDTLHDSSVALN